MERGGCSDGEPGECASNVCVVLCCAVLCVVCVCVCVYVVLCACVLVGGWVGAP